MRTLQRLGQGLLAKEASGEDGGGQTGDDPEVAAMAELLAMTQESYFSEMEQRSKVVQAHASEVNSLTQMMQVRVHSSAYVFKRFQWIGNQIHWIGPEGCCRRPPQKPRGDFVLGEALRYRWNLHKTPHVTLLYTCTYT